MAPLLFLEFDISQAAYLAYPVRFCWILTNFHFQTMVSAAPQIFFLEI